MVAKRGIAACAALLFALAALGAQEPAAPAAQEPSTPEAEQGAEKATAYYFKLGEDGEPVFTQVLHWDADPDALEYGIVLRDSGGKDIFDGRTQESSKEFHLPPGSYRYKIVTYNLLGKAEAETDWIDFDVIKAEQPGLSMASPSTLFMDSLDGRVTLSGEKLSPEGVVTLVPKIGKAPSKGKIVKQIDDREIVVVFPDSAYAQGEYSIAFENPGGLSATLDDALRIRFQRPVDILLSLGYSPYCSLGNQWLHENWPSSFVPLGFDSRLELFFVKQHWGFLGLELGAEWRRMVGGETAATITSDYVLMGVDALYKYRFTRQLHGLARLGGGLSRSYHSFDYEGFDGPTATSYDPFARFGLALQAFLPCKIFGELGADFTYISLLNEYAMGISPSLSLGYQLY